MKQGNNNNSCSTCNCEYLQLHLLSAPKSLFSEKFNVRIIFIILFIALVASFSLKYLPISEIKFVPLLMGMEVLVICFAHYKFTKILPYRQASIPFYFRWLRHIC